MALGDAKDDHHDEVIEIYEEAKRIGEKIITSDYVLQELITLLFRRAPAVESRRFIEGILKAGEREMLIIERIESDRFRKAWELKKKLIDKPKISFVDVSSVIVMKELKIERIMTMDTHFLQIGCCFVTVPRIV